jgi:hypothetical protein
VIKFSPLHNIKVPEVSCDMISIWSRCHFASLL